MPKRDSVRNDTLELNLRAIPDDWMRSTIGQECTIGGGGTPSRLRKEYFTGDIPWIKSTELNYRTIRSAGENITSDALQNSSTRMYPPGTLLIAITGFEAEGTRGQVRDSWHRCSNQPVVRCNAVEGANPHTISLLLLSVSGKPSHVDS